METELEEIYYFEIQVEGAAAGRSAEGADPVGYQRVYGTDERPIDVLAEVRTGDVVLVPHGWHGPAMAAPGYDLYYLNVMAGPGPEPGLADLRRPQPRLGPRHLGRPGTSTPDCPSPRGQRDERDRPADRRPGDGASSWRTSGPSATASGRSCSPAASASSATATSPASARRCCSTRPPRRRASDRACRTCWPATSRPWCTPRSRYARQKDRLQTWVCTASRRPRLDQHADRRGAGHDQPAAGAAAAVGHLRDPASRRRCCRSSRRRTPATSPSTTRSARCRGTSTGSAGPSSCRRRCSAPCGC